MLWGVHVPLTLPYSFALYVIVYVPPPHFWVGFTWVGEYISYDPTGAGVTVQLCPYMASKLYERRCPRVSLASNVILSLSPGPKVMMSHGLTSFGMVFGLMCNIDSIFVVGLVLSI